MEKVTGLSSTQAAERLKVHGLNDLPNSTNLSVLRLIFDQFTNLLVGLLFVAAIISFFIGDRVDSILILVILLLNAAMGFWQEYKASKELSALKTLEVQYCRCLRDGVEQKIKAQELVPGDVIILESGDKVPADGSLFEARNLSINESSLTGESAAVVKSIDQDDNQVFLGSWVISGRGKMVVEKTGLSTRFGQIALTLSDVEEEPTPLEVKLKRLAKITGLFAIAISLLLFILQIQQGHNIIEVFFTSTAFMVAIVPEGLPAVITLVLALGVRRMYKKRALIRKLSAVEGLGGTTVICTDKTGTLTKNEMSVNQVVLEVKSDEDELIKATVLCNSASLVIKENNQPEILGDTTEGALLTWAISKGVDINKLKSAGELVEEVPFSSETKMMSVVWRTNGVNNVYIKGAPEIILKKCHLEKAKKDNLIAKYEKMASQGLRVLAFAEKIGSKDLEADNYHFLALLGVADAPKEEARVAITRAKQAGIKVVMVTGDNELTAKAIGEEVGLLSEDDEIITGSQLDELTDQEFYQLLPKIKIFARVSPENKLKIIKGYETQGEIVAVTGDGVNDALALKQAHVGVAMGTKGTEVAKEASDVVILDDNLSSIVSAVEEGRLIYINIVKVVRFLLAGNFSEVLLILVAVLLGFPTPLLPVQILWVNLVTDSLPALSLAADHPSTNLMNQPPRKKDLNILENKTLQYIFFGGGSVALMSFLIFILALNRFDISVARSLTFSAIVILQMLLVLVVSKHKNLLANRYLIGSVVFILVLQILITFYPPLQQIFKTRIDF